MSAQRASSNTASTSSGPWTPVTMYAPIERGPNLCRAWPIASNTDRLRLPIASKGVTGP